jgi:hypothetical protein
VTLTIATWNLENLFLAGGKSGPPDQETFERKLDDLAATANRTRTGSACRRSSGGA